ncbi:MAG: ribonuclease J [Patescibacteria group bacterium]|nr:ribonuclease J [Patescibacteria group bacterium]MBU0879512.1 ribonuclease J [Patescibacteria group bacterium]MBU0880415.1 ribonuclease J [Patescibacteria group bacterium]MBU1062902.1 ribonuclease J [Patescibacteria group bacterium]MBU1783386.1 ribonuclease J [Patescibacteria group bacterium]
MITKYKSKFREQVSEDRFKTNSVSAIPVNAGGLINGEKLRVMVLGGLEEVGRNMTLLEYNKEIIIIDMGMQFPEEDMPGIDYIIPNVAYLEGKEDWIKGVIISHGHMDHVGGIPHLMGKIGNPPMFMGKLTAGIVRKRVEEFSLCPKLAITEMDETTSLQLGKNFKVEFLRVNHSIPDCFATIVNTPIGTVIHTGDFKIDYSPVNDKPADLNRIAQIGGKGVLLLMSDSTDATHPGYQVSESSIGDEMSKIFEKLEGRIIIGTFASQLSRVQKILELAEKFDRRVFLQGRSMNNNVEIAQQIGYLKFNPKILAEDYELSKMPDNKIIVLGTGAQGENGAFLVRVVNGEHRNISLKSGDTVIFSSSVIPGNERTIQTLRDSMVRQGARVINYEMMDIHAGGHAKQEDLKLMMRLIKPEHFMPIEANHYMLQAHAELAEQVGISKQKIFVADNGQVIEFVKNNQNIVIGKLTSEKVPTNYIMVDGLGVGDVSNIVLRDRRVMAEDGMIVIIVTIDSKTGDPIGNPDIISRGFIYMKENKELIQKTRMKVKKIVKDHMPKVPVDDDYIKNKIRNDIGQFLFGQIKRRPMVLPVVIKV